MFILLLLFFFLESLDDTVALERGQGQVEEPEAEEQARGEDTGLLRAAELATAELHATDHHERDGNQCERAEERDREGQAARDHNELGAVPGVVEGGRHPGEADAQEHVDRIRAGHVADRAVGVLVVYGSHFASKCI
jgi:hypothetical protein